jgi:SAM-dependent methyltransferase
MRGIPARSWQGIVSNCDPIPLPDESASVIICTEVMEHVDDPARLAAELARIGKPGARYMISVPDPASERLMEHVAPPWYWEPPYHRRVFQHHELDAVLEAAGIHVERRDVGGSYYALRWLLWMTLVAKPYDTAEETPLMIIWEEIWETLMASPHSSQILYGLERTLPKSQAVLAFKSGGSRLARLRRRLLGPTAWRRRLRSGRLRLGGFEFGWYARRDPQAR